MKTANWVTLLSLLAVCCLVVFGCDKKEAGGTAPTTPSQSGSSTAQAKVDADKMDVEQLRAAALKCKADAEAKTSEIEKVAQELIKALGADSADKRKELNTRMEGLRKSEEALYAQLKVYVEKLKEKGGDMSGLNP